MTALSTLLENLPGYTLISSDMKTDALNNARIPDSSGVWPDQPGYVPTFDNYYAALTLLGFLQAQPTVTSVSSEGTSVATSAPDWRALAMFWKSMSPIMQAQGNAVLQRVNIPDIPHVQKVNMRDRGGYYGDIDTDIN